MKVQVHVTLKPGVLDPQGKAIHHALEGLGFAGVADVRAGRFFELEVADDVTAADLDAMCAKLLANTVIENSRITIGRASCRERGCPYVEISVVAGSFKKKNTKTQ